MNNISLIPARRATRELKDAYAAARGYVGFRSPFRVAPQVVRGLGHRPRLLRSAFETYFYSSRCGRLDCATRELTAMLVSRSNDCFY